MPLDPLHLADLRKSGLTDETIDKAGFASLRPCDIEKETGIRSLPVLSAYRIPFDTGYSRFKLFYREEAPDGAKWPKYIQKSGQQNRLYIPVLLELLLKDISRPLYITEGEKKSLKAAQEGIVCIAITGLWNWKRKGTDELVQDFDGIALKGRVVCIIPDSDWLDLNSKGKPKNLKQAVERLAVALQLKGARVSICAMPADNGGKVGLDDYLLKHSVDDFNSLPRQTVPLRTCYRLEDSTIRLYEVKQEKDDDGEIISLFAPPVNLASSIQIIAYTRNHRQEEWGRLLSFHDKDGHLHQWAMPMELLSSDGAELRRELLRRGLAYIHPSIKYRQHLISYLQMTPPDEERRARCTDTTGWHNRAFIIPGCTIGQTDEALLYQGNAENVMRQSGTLEEWQKKVARLCIDNTRLVFAVSCAFAATLLHICGKENGGFNYFGQSSTGKTTALFAACSVYGGADYLQRWRATSNGLEGIATAHNDLLLILDELAQVDAREAGEIAYMLANGSGKNRAGKTGDARPKKQWRTLFLSSGEITLADHIRACGKKAKAGQEVRLADIPADTGKHGIFEELHGYADGAALSRSFKEAAASAYGTAGIEFIRRLTEEWEEIPGAVEKVRSQFIAQLPKGCDGQIQRVAERFALVAAAGEMATAFGITGWQPGEAAKSAHACLQAWIQARGGTGPQEERVILSQVRLFFEQHGESRFSEWEEPDARTTINRAGFRRKIVTDIDNGSYEYYVLNETFREEICNGFNCQTAAKLLVQKDILQPGTDGRTSKLVRLPGMGQVRCYHINRAVLEADQ
jgi:uncharacterized protein (DUF927 family)